MNERPGPSRNEHWGSDVLPTEYVQFKLDNVEPVPMHRFVETFLPLQQLSGVFGPGWT